MPERWRDAPPAAPTPHENGPGPSRVLCKSRPRQDGRARATAVGYNATALNVGTATYPAVGGALAVWAWYWPFVLPLLALPLGTALAWTLSPLDSEGQQGPDHFREYLAVVGDRLATGGSWASCS